MNDVIKIVKNYWLSEESNIFKNYRDALAGFIVLIVIPAMSILLVVHTSDCSFWNYTFPLVSISMAGAYDTYGRYSGASPKNVKLAIRIILNFLAIVFTAFATDNNNSALSFVAPILLLLCGLFLLYEIFNRLKIAVQISPWLFLDR